MRVPILTLTLALAVPVVARGQEPARTQQPAQREQMTRMQRMQENTTRMERLMTRLIGRPQRWISVAMSAGRTSLISPQLFDHALDLLRSGKRTPVLELPQWVPPMLGAALSLAGLLLFVLALARSRARP